MAGDAHARSADRRALSALRAMSIEGKGPFRLIALRANITDTTCSQVEEQAQADGYHIRRSASSAWLSPTGIALAFAPLRLAAGVTV